MTFATGEAAHENRACEMVHKSGAQRNCLVWVFNMLIGYARVSSQGQSLDCQIGA